MATSDLTDLTQEWYRHWERSMGTFWDQVLDDPGFIKSMGDGLAASSKARHGWESQVDKTMEAMHLPSRKDVVRVARIASLLEDRLLAMEDRQLDDRDTLARLEKETLQARVDAAEARVDVREQLAAVEAKLDALMAKVEALQPKPTRTRRKKAE